MHITAVVVTYNRLEKLKKVLDYLLKQDRKVDEILVVDNASTDDTPVYLAQWQKETPSARVITAKTNEGGAGGFYRGVKAAFESGSDYIWIMDDDCYAKKDTLSKLLKGYDHVKENSSFTPAFACSLVKWHNDDLCEMNNPRTVWDWPRFFAKDTPYCLVDSCSFVSVLVPRGKIKQMGYPIKDYFIWFDDAEYTRRLVKAGGPGVAVLDSIVHHDLPDNKGVNYGLINDSNLWKFKYGARNEASYWLHQEKDKKEFILFILRIKKQMRQGKVDKKLRKEILKAAFSAIKFNPQIEIPK